MKTQVCEINIGGQISRVEIVLPEQPETKLTIAIRELLEQAFLAGYQYGNERDETDEELLSNKSWLESRDSIVRGIME